MKWEEWAIIIFFLLAALSLVIYFVVFYEPGCSDSRPCLPPLICVKGTCTKRPPCVADSDCAPGLICRAGNCLPPRACLNDHDCPPGTSCAGSECARKACRDSSECKDLSDEAACLPPSSIAAESQEVRSQEPGSSLGVGACYLKSCITTGICGPSERCVDGVCVKLGSCSSDADCPRNSFCNSEGQCVQCTAQNNPGCVCIQERCLPKTCSNDNQCPTGSFCIPVAGCLPYQEACGLTSCKSSADCPASCPYCWGTRCYNQKAPNRAPCTNDSDCQSDTCRHSPTGSGSYCYPRGANTCLTPQDCTNPQQGLWCLDGKCQSTILGSLCATKGCIGGLYCVNDVCSLEKGSLGDRCLQSSDCRDTLGLICRNGYCQS